MTARTGFTPVGSIGETSSTTLTLNLSVIDSYFYKDEVDQTFEVLDGIHTVGSLPTIYNVQRQGGSVTGFFTDLYERVNITPNTFDFGTLVANKSKTFTVWNAFTRQHIHSEPITGPTKAQSGVEIAADSLNTLFTNLQVREYTVTADVVGPPTIDFVFQLHFDTVSSSYLFTSGTRASIWGNIPQKGWQETYDWLTDTIEAYSGKKQRIALRSQPRIGFVHKYAALNHTDRGRILNKIKSTVSNNYAVPIWSQFKRLTQTTAVDTDTIYIDTTYMDIQEGSFLLLWSSDIAYEAVIIKTIEVDHIVVENTVKRSYATGDICAPLILCYLPNEINHDLSPLNKTDYTIQFKANNGTPIQDVDLPDSYNDGVDNLDVFVNESLLINTRKKTVVNKAKRQSIDNNTGAHTIDYSFNHAVSVHSITQRFQSRESAWNFRGWLQKMKGRQGVFFLPDYNQTIEVVGQILYDASLIKIVDVELTSSFVLTPLITHIFIMLKDGTKLYKKIDSVGKNYPYEDIVLTTTVGYAFSMDDIQKIGLMNKVASTRDNLIFDYTTDGMCTVSLTAEEVL